MSSRLFFGTDHPRRRPPYAVLLLLGVNTAVYLLSPLAGPDAAYAYGLVPGSPSLVGFFASLFIHASGLHLAVNLALLWLVARDVEDALGHIETLILYVASGLAANVLQAAAMLVIDPTATSMPQVGASGAVSGMLGLFAVRWYFLSILWGFGESKSAEGVYRIPAWWLVTGLVAFQILGAARSLWGNAEMVGYWGHLGGFVFGAAVGEALRLGRMASADILARRARAAAQLGDHLTAARLYGKLLDAFGDRITDPSVLIEVGDSHDLVGDRGVAKDCYVRALTGALNGGAIQETHAAWQALRRIPGAYRALPRERLERLANLLEQRHDFADAAALHAAIASLSQGPTAAGALYHQARILARRLNSRDAAERVLSRLRLEHPDSQWTRAAEELMGAETAPNP